MVQRRQRERSLFEVLLPDGQGAVGALLASTAPAASIGGVAVRASSRPAVAA